MDWIVVEHEECLERQEIELVEHHPSSAKHKPFFVNIQRRVPPEQRQPTGKSMKTIERLSYEEWWNWKEWPNSFSDTKEWDRWITFRLCLPSSD